MRQQNQDTWFILPGAMSGDMWHIAASLILEPKAQLLMEADPLFYDLYERVHGRRQGDFQGNANIPELLVKDYNTFLKAEKLDPSMQQRTDEGASLHMFNAAKRLRQWIKESRKRYYLEHPHATADDAIPHYYDTLLKYMASETSTLRLLESSAIGNDRYHLVENKTNIASTEGSYQTRAIDAVIADPKWRDITGYIGTHTAASSIVAKHLQRDPSGTCKTLTDNMGSEARTAAVARVRELVKDVAFVPPGGGHVLLINMRCAPYNRHQNVTVHMMHQLIERVAKYNKTHPDKLYIRPLGAFTTTNQGSGEQIDKIRLSDFIAGYTRDHPDAPLLPALDFYGRLASLETTVDTRMTDPASIMEFWREAAKEPAVAGVIGGRSGSLHIASYAFADPKKVLAWDIPYPFDRRTKEGEVKDAHKNVTYRHQDFVRFAMEYPLLSIVPLHNGSKLQFQSNALGLIDNFLSGKPPRGLSTKELSKYLGASKNYLPYLRSSPSLQPPEDMQKAASRVSVVNEDIVKWFANGRDKDKHADAPIPDTALASAHPRVLFFTESKQGLGHFNVTNQVTRELTSLGANCAVASGSFDHGGAQYAFEHAEKFELPSLPKIIISREESLSKYPEIIAKRKQAIKDACEKFKPDLVVFETYPFATPAREDDAIALREWSQAHERKIPVTCLVRDIMFSDHPDDVLRQLKEYFDRLFVRGSGDIVKLEDCMKEWKNISIPTAYTGNIVSPMPPREGKPSAKDPVIVFGGGGYDKKVDQEFFDHTVRSFAHAGELKSRPWEIYVSANYPQPLFDELQKLAKETSPDNKITVHRTIAEDAFKQRLSNSAVCITRGGYNTCFELASIKKPFLIIPRDAADKEQTMRAQRMADHGFCASVMQPEASPETVGKLLLQQYKAPAPKMEVNTTGGKVLAQALISTAQGRGDGVGGGVDASVAPSGPQNTVLSDAVIAPLASYPVSQAALIREPA